MKTRPLDFPDREPIRNDVGPVDSSQIIRGSEVFSLLTTNSGGLVTPTEQSALTISAVYASINLLAGAISALPVNIYKRAADGELDKLPSDDLHWILNEQMTPRWSAASGWEFMAQSLLMHGDAFAKIKRRGPLVAGLEPVHPQRVTVTPTPDGMRLVYAIEPDPYASAQQREVLDQDDVLHVAGFGFDGCRGLSPLRYALRMTGAVSLATQDYAARFFANSARPDMILETDQKLGPDAVDKLREQIAERHGTAHGQAHKPMVLTNGLTAKTLQMPIEDLQLLELRQFQIEEIARIYGIPPFMIGHNEKTTSWGSGVEAMGTGFVRYALRQHLNKFQNELNRKLFRTAAKVAEFDTADLERADFKSMVEAFRAGLGRAGEQPIFSQNEARAAFRLKRVPGGDSTEGMSAPAPAPTEASNAPDQAA